MGFLDRVRKVILEGHSHKDEPLEELSSGKPVTQVFFELVDTPIDNIPIGEDRKFRPNTPAMKAGITEHP